MSWKSKAGKWVRSFAQSERNYVVARIEANTALQRMRSALTVAHRKRIAELQDARGLSINVGSGGRGFPGWVNIDAVPGPDDALPLDIRRPLPFADGSVRRAFAEHVLEHLGFRDEAPQLLAELLRVLEPGGVLRVIVPDAQRFVEAYASSDPQRWRALGWDVERLPHDIHTPMHVLNHIFHQSGEHQFGYDFETLAWLLREVGFEQVERMRFGQSLDSELAIDRDEHAPYSLYVDARKPV